METAVLKDGTIILDIKEVANYEIDNSFFIFYLEGEDHIIISKELIERIRTW